MQYRRLVSSRMRFPAMSWHAIGRVALVAVLGTLSCGEDPVFATGRVSGVVWVTGPVSGAIVSAYQCNDEGERFEKLGESAPTGEDGVFQIDVGTGLEVLCLDVRGVGARYVELATGEPVEPDDEVFLRTVLIDFGADEERSNVVISPLTTMGVALAGARLANGKEATYSEAVARSYTLLGTHFGNVEIGATAPMDVSATSASALTADVRYGFVLAGLSRLAKFIAEDSNLTTNAISSLGVTEKLALDLSDVPTALFDGEGPDGPITLGSCPLPPGCAGDACDTRCAFDSNTPRYDLGTAITDFVASSRNVTGLGWNDVRALVEAISTNDEPELFPPGGGQFDTTPPELAWDPPTPEDGAIVRATIQVRAHATDLVTAEPVAAWTAPAGLVDEDGDPTNAVVLGTIDTTAIAEGALVVSASAEDEAGNVVEASRTFTIDNTPPEIGIAGVADGGTYATAVTPTVTFTDLHLVSSSITLNGAPFVSGTTVSADGTYTLAATAGDEAGNASASSVTFTIDADAPTITWGPTTPAVTEVLGGPLSATATASDPQGVASFVIVEPAGASDTDGTLTGIAYVETPPANAEYSRTLRLRALDTLGNQAEDARTWAIDTWAPRIAIGGVVDQTYYNTARVPTWGVTDANLTSSGASLNGAPFVSGTMVAAEGTYTLAVSASDAAGHDASESRTFTIDLTAPTIGISGVANNVAYPNAVTPVISVTDAHPGSSTITLNGAPFVSGTTVSADGTYTLVVQATDAAGNSASVTVVFTIDTVDPTIVVVSPTVGAAFNGDLAIEATASDLHLATFVIAGPAAIAGLDSDGTVGRVQTVVPAGTFADGPVTIELRAADTAGNVTTVSVPVVVDTAPPTVTIAAPTNDTWTASATVNVDVSASDTTSSVQSVTVTANGTDYAATDPDGDGVWRATVGLVADACGAVPWQGENDIYVSATDAAGNSAAPQLLRVNYDNCNPGLTVVANPIYDERSFGAGFKTTSYAPCFYHLTASPPQTTLSYDVNAATPPAAPTVYKYAINTGASGQAGCPAGSYAGTSPASLASYTAETGSNPIRWHLKATDNRGVATVEYQLRNPSGVVVASGNAQVYATPTTTHQITITRDLAGAAALATMDGTWELALTVTDWTGRTFTPPQPIRWVHRLLGGPVYVESQSPDAPSGSNYLIPSSFGLGAGQSIAPLYTTTGNKIVVRKYRIYNGTPTSTQLTVTPQVSMGGTRTIHVRNPNNGTRANQSGPNCASGAFSPDTTTGSCLTTYPTDSTTTVNNLSDTTFIKAVEAWDPGSGAPHLSCAGCGASEFLG